LCSGSTWKRVLRAWLRFSTGYIYNVQDFADYLQLCGGLPRLQQLRRQEFLLDRDSG